MSSNNVEITIRECETVEDFQTCVRLQKEAFGLPDIEISPLRHFVVTKQAGGWTLGAFIDDEMVGFVHHLVSAIGEEVFGYSHMMSVAVKHQNKGIGAMLKWAQRQKAFEQMRRFIKWTWEPMQARNAHFNLNRLGVIVRSYAVNFYGTDYTQPSRELQIGLDSDRLFAEWQLDSPRVITLSEGKEHRIEATPAREIIIVPNWRELQKQNPEQANEELLRVRTEFENAFSDRLICASFERDNEKPRYLLYNPNELEGQI